MPETASVPEIYADIVHISTGNLGIFLGFRAATPFDQVSSESDESESQPGMPMPLKAVVRMDPKDAKAFAILLRASLKSYEEEGGTIPLPAGFAEATGLEVDEW
jgi:hypothetical protein